MLCTTRRFTALVSRMVWRSFLRVKIKSSFTDLAPKAPVESFRGPDEVTFRKTCQKREGQIGNQSRRARRLRISVLSRRSAATRAIQQKKSRAQRRNVRAGGAQTLVNRFLFRSPWSDNTSWVRLGNSRMASVRYPAPVRSDPPYADNQPQWRVHQRNRSQRLKGQNIRQT
jgi:hypothetical protein